MSEFLSLRELQKVFSLPTSQAIKAAYENSGGNSVTILNNVDLLSLIDEIGGIVGQIRGISKRIERLEAALDISTSAHNLKARLDRIEANLPSPQSLKPITKRLDQLEAQI